MLSKGSEMAHALPTSRRMETRKDHKRNAYPFVCKSSRKDRIGSIDYRRLQCVKNKRTMYHEVLKNSLPTSYCSCWIRPAWRNFGEASASQFASNVKGAVFADHYIRSLTGSVLINYVIQFFFSGSFCWPFRNIPMLPMAVLAVPAKFGLEM